MKNEIERNEPTTAMEKIAAFAIAIWPILFIMGIGALCGCGKSVDVEGKGMYANANSGVVGIGSFEVVTVPDGNEAARIQYSEDTAWLSPTTKTHAFKINLCGTNSVDQVGCIVSNICQAFIQTAPAIAAINSGSEIVVPTNGPGAVVSAAVNGTHTESGEIAKTLTNVVEAVTLPTNVVEAVSATTNVVDVSGDSTCTNCVLEAKE